MFNIEIENRECVVVDGYNIIKQLKCKLKRSVKESKQDELEECITSIFGKLNCDINSDTNVLSDEIMDGETVQVIHDDYNYNIREPLDTNESPNSTNTSDAKVSALGLGNIFVLGNAKMIESKIPEVRERKQDRMLRSRAFFLKVHDIVTNAEETANSELNSNDKSMIPNPWFRQYYRNITD